jgi:hypothetical protein
MLDFLQDVLTRQWHDLMARPSGPMSFRFLLQPTMAVLFAIRDGIRDARTRRTPYLWTILRDREHRGARVREGLESTSRIILLGLVMDAIYQFIVFRAFYPGEALIIALALACVPYFLIRGPAARIARRVRKHHAPQTK